MTIRRRGKRVVATLTSLLGIASVGVATAASIVLFDHTEAHKVAAIERAPSVPTSPASASATPVPLPAPITPTSTPSSTATATVVTPTPQPVKPAPQPVKVVAPPAPAPPVAKSSGS